MQHQQLMYRFQSAGGKNLNVSFFSLLSLILSPPLFLSLSLCPLRMTRTLTITRRLRPIWNVGKRRRPPTHGVPRATALWQRQGRPRGRRSRPRSRGSSPASSCPSTALVSGQCEERACRCWGGSGGVSPSLQRHPARLIMCFSTKCLCGEKSSGSLRLSTLQLNRLRGRGTAALMCTKQVYLSFSTARLSVRTAKLREKKKHDICIP